MKKERKEKKVYDNEPHTTKCNTKTYSNICQSKREIETEIEKTKPNDT
jgi:hypothetical protein